MPLNRDGTEVLQVQALRNRVADLEQSLSDTQLVLRLTQDQRDRRLQTADALRMALSDRTKPMPNIEIDDVAPVMRALRSERKIRRQAELELNRKKTELDQSLTRNRQLEAETIALRDDIDYWRGQAIRKSRALSSANQTTSRLALVLSEKAQG